MRTCAWGSAFGHTEALHDFLSTLSYSNPNLSRGSLQACFSHIEGLRFPLLGVVVASAMPLPHPSCFTSLLAQGALPGCDVACGQCDHMQAAPRRERGAESRGRHADTQGSTRPLARPPPTTMDSGARTLRRRQSSPEIADDCSTDKFCSVSGINAVIARPDCSIVGRVLSGGALPRVGKGHDLCACTGH